MHTGLRHCILSSNTFDVRVISATIYPSLVPFYPSSIPSSLFSLSCLSLQVRDHPQRASRVLLDIEAGAPVILIPESSRSPRVIVANLGQLRVQNCFLPAGAHGTFSLRDKVEKLTMAHAFFPSLVSHAARSSTRVVLPDHPLTSSPFCLISLYSFMHLVVSPTF